MKYFNSHNNITKDFLSLSSSHSGTQAVGTERACDRLFQTANGAQSPVRKELYNSRIAHRVFFLFAQLQLSRLVSIVRRSD